MSSPITVRLDPELESRLDAVALATGRSRSEIIRDALRRQLAVSRFETIRNRIMPFAEAQGLLTDDDVQKIVS